MSSTDVVFVRGTQVYPSHVIMWTKTPQVSQSQYFLFSGDTTYVLGSTSYMAERSEVNCLCTWPKFLEISKSSSKFTTILAFLGKVANTLHRQKTSDLTAKYEVYIDVGQICTGYTSKWTPCANQLKSAQVSIGAGLKIRQAPIRQLASQQRGHLNQRVVAQVLYRFGQDM